MAAATVLYTLNLGGNLDNKVPKLSADLRKLGAEADRAHNKIENAAEKGLKKFGYFGGEAADAIFDFIIPLREASAGLGVMGTALAGTAAIGVGAVAAFGLAAVGLKGVADEALAARDRLLALGIHVGVEQRADMAAYAQATKELGIAFDQMKVAIGSEVAGDLAVIGKVIADNIGPTIEWIKWLKELSATAHNIGTLGMAGLIGGAGGSTAAQARADLDAAASAQKLVDSYKNLGEEVLKTGVEEQTRNEVLKETARLTKTATSAAKDYASVVSGAGVGAGGVSLGGPGIPMGAQSTDRAGDTASLFRDEAAKLGRIDDGIDHVGTNMEHATALLGGIDGGISGMLGMIPVYGQMMAAIWEAMKSIGDDSVNYANEIVSTISNFGEQLSRTITDVPMVIIDGLPDMAAGIITAIPRLILELVASGPRLFAALIEAFMDLPAAIGNEFKYMWEQFIIDIREAFEDIAGAFTNKDGKFLGTSFSGEKNEGDRSFFGIGGSRESTSRSAAPGASQSQRARATPGNSQPVVFNVYQPTSGERFVRDVNAQLGSYGRGLKIGPNGTPR